MGLLFFPRGGSAQVVRYLSRSLPGAGWDAAIACGSLGVEGEQSHAGTFFPGLKIHALDYTPSLDAADPVAADPPFHPSYEDRPGAPDRVFASVAEPEYERLVETWIGQLEQAGAGDADLLHLHHLTPINEAAERAFPGVPRVGHIHGTELAMVRAIDAGATPEWRHGEEWADRMRRWAGGCERLFVLSPVGVELVPGVLGVPPERVVWSPNGFEPEYFQPLRKRGEERVAHWRRWLVEDPQGWDHSGQPGSVRYSEEDVQAFAGDSRALIFSGRYTALKRIPLMISAYAKATRHFERRAPLVLLGGFPGEYEGLHPLDVIEETGTEGVFLAGWRPHDQLGEGLNAADALVLASAHEEFGQVVVEAMACGIPPIAANAHGPGEIVDHGKTGWLFTPDDEDSLAEALVAAVNDEEERERRGAAALEEARAHYSWPAIAKDVAGVYEGVLRS
jgi:glycosyltransferase involved in cell wall biosynthesis